MVRDLLKHPDKVDDRAIRYMDALIYVLQSEPVVLSDFRDGDPKTHGRGLAIDTTWPDIDPIQVLRVSLNLNLWGGVGIYLNEVGYVSLHHDIRDHKPDGSIATWGCLITPDGAGRKYDYTTMDRVTAMIRSGQVPQ